MSCAGWAAATRSYNRKKWQPRCAKRNDPFAFRPQVTMDTYVQAVSDEKRKAQSKVVEMVMPGIRKAAR